MEIYAAQADKESAFQKRETHTKDMFLLDSPR